MSQEDADRLLMVATTVALVTRTPLEVVLEMDVRDVYTLYFATEATA